MKKLSAIYFFLLILLVMGAFASMAQNSYGLKIMGGVAFTFALLFITEFISLSGAKEKIGLLTLAEPACLAIISIIFGLRVFYIHFDYVEVLFVIAVVLLLLLYLVKMVLRYRHFQLKNRAMGILLLIFYLSIILFLVSLALVLFAERTAEYVGVISFVLLVFFFIVGLLKKKFLVEGEKISVFTFVRKFKDHSLIIVSLIIMFSLYFGFNKTGILPAIYSDEYPRAYFKLVEKAARGKEEAVDGKYKHELFMEKYKQFVRKNKFKDN